MIRPVWVRLPVEIDCGEKTPELCEGDDYLVRLETGEVLWGTWTIDRGKYFARIDDLGAGASELNGNGITGVVEVMISGYSRENIAAALGRPLSITDRLVADVLAQIPAAMAKAKQLVERDSRVAS